jgi:hypothetical protein
MLGNVDESECVVAWGRRKRLHNLGMLGFGDYI